MIFRYLYAALGHLEIYTASFLRKISDILRKRPRLLLAAVILFSAIWSVFSQAAGSEQLVLDYINQDKLFTEEKVFNKENSLGLKAPYLTANNSAVFNLNSSGILATQVEPTDEPEESEQGGSLASLYGSALLSQTGPVTFISQEPRTGIITYVVQEGDTPSTIAAFFGITTNTLLWSNKLQDGSIIRPGDELTILPISGVIHKVKSGQTVGWIANYYKASADDILGFNDLPADGQIIEGEQLVVPDGVMPPPPAPKPRYVARAPSQSYSGAGTGKSRAFPYGQCTWYVAQKRVVPWSGDAKNWIDNAQALGYLVCRGSQCQPKAGAIMSIGGNTWLIRRYGHVAYVESVNGDWVTFSEMNYLGWGVKSVRTIHKNSSLIRGYIY